MRTVYFSCSNNSAITMREAVKLALSKLQLEVTSFNNLNIPKNSTIPEKEKIQSEAIRKADIFVQLYPITRLSNHYDNFDDYLREGTINPVVGKGILTEHGFRLKSPYPYHIVLIPLYFKGIMHMVVADGNHKNFPDFKLINEGKDFVNYVELVLTTEISGKKNKFIKKANSPFFFSNSLSQNLDTGEFSNPGVHYSKVREMLIQTLTENAISSTIQMIIDRRQTITINEEALQECSQELYVGSLNLSEEVKDMLSTSVIADVGVGTILADADLNGAIIGRPKDYPVGHNTSHALDFESLSEETLMKYSTQTDYYQRVFNINNKPMVPSECIKQKYLFRFPLFRRLFTKIVK